MSYAADGVGPEHVICPYCKKSSPNLIYLTNDGIRLITARGIEASDVRYFNLSEFAEMAFEGW